MRTAATLFLVSVLCLAAPLARAEDAPAGPDTSRSTVAQLELGEYWWGAEVNKDDLGGKVVLWVIWGS